MTAKSVNLKDAFIIKIAAVCLLLGICWVFLNAKSGVLKKNNEQQEAVLKKTLPDFDQKSVNRLDQDIKDLNARILGLSLVFDPKYKWEKKGYDPSIYFVEELGNIRQALKQKAKEKGVQLPDLGFKERLPSETEAGYLLNQLFGLKEVISLGMDYGVNFKTIEPQPPQEKNEMAGVRSVKSKLSVSCPAQALIEFIIRINEVMPKVGFDSLSLKLSDSNYDIDMVLEHILVDVNPDIKSDQEAAPEVKSFSAGPADAVNVLRSNNPFFIPEAKEEPKEKGVEQPKAPKPAERFIFRGKATLRSKPVVAIEDTLKQETVFVGKNERISDFILMDFSDNSAVLKNINDNKNLVIKGEENK